ncbi:MAG: DinB family protein [Thermoanaerobaculia bacterium]
MEDHERRRHLETLAATRTALKAAVRGLPKKVLLFTPAPGKWSILEILVHLRDMEREAYLERYRRILAEEEPRLPDLNGEAFAIERAYRSAKPAEVLRDWSRLRRESLGLLFKMKADQWARAGHHETAGRLTMEDLLRRHAVGNDEAHLGQIEAIKRRYALFEKLAAAPAALADALKGVSDAALRRRPAPEKWSMIENAAHVRDIERLYQMRFSKIAFGDRPAFWMLDNDRAAAELKYGEADPVAVVREFRRLREETRTLLGSLPHELWRKTGLHPKRGELTLEELAGVLAGHDERHLAAIRSLRGTDLRP